MKQKPQKLPSRYLVRYNDKIGEWQVRKKFIFIDENGFKKDTATKWCLTVEEAERISRERINHAFIQYDLKITKKKTIKSLLSDYVEELHNLSMENINFKSTTRKDNYEKTRSLLEHHLPDNIANIEIKNLQPSDFTLWLRDINKSSLSGRRVRAFRTTINAFSDYLLENGYIALDFQLLVRHSLSTTKLKKETVGSRHDRNEINVEGLYKILKYYKSQDLGLFDNFYWFNLWLFLFCTGVRVGELIALQWKNVIFDDSPSSNVIYIRNSIAQKQTKENVKNILKNKNESPKNKKSNRNITMWASYRNSLKNYKESYLYHYKINSYEDMSELYVFPNLRSLDDKLSYQTHKNLLRELERVCKKPSVDIPVPDVQMFRHGCAKFLAYDCCFPIEETKHYLGHTDSSMIENVYAPLEAEERRKQVSRTQQSLISDTGLTFKNSKTVNASLFEVSSNNNLIDFADNEDRIYRQILMAIKRGKDTYYYSNEDTIDIFSIEDKHPEILDKIKLVCRD